MPFSRDGRRLIERFRPDPFYLVYPATRPQVSCGTISRMVAQYGLNLADV